MLGTEGPGDIVQRFGMADQQITAGKQVVIKGVDDVFLHLVIEINDDVAAKNNMRPLHTLELHPVRQVDLAKRHQPLDLGFELETAPVRREIAGNDFLRRGAQGVFAVDPLPGLGQDGLGQIVGRDADIPGADFRAQHLVENDGNGVRLLAGGAAGGPDAEPALLEGLEAVQGVLQDHD